MGKEIAKKGDSKHRRGLSKLSTTQGVPFNCATSYGTAKLVPVTVDESYGRRKNIITHHGFIVTDPDHPFPATAWDLARNPVKSARQYGAPSPAIFTGPLLWMSFWAIMFNIGPVGIMVWYTFMGVMGFRNWHKEILRKAIESNDTPFLLEYTTHTTNSGTEEVELHETSSAVVTWQDRYSEQNNAIVLRIVNNNPTLWSEILDSDVLWDVLGTANGHVSVFDTDVAPVSKIRELAKKLNKVNETELALVSLYSIQFHEEFLDEELDEIAGIIRRMLETLDEEWRVTEANRVQTELLAGGVADPESARRSVEEHAEFMLDDFFTKSQQETEALRQASKAMEELYGVSAPELPSVLDNVDYETIDENDIEIIDDTSKTDDDDFNITDNDANDPLRFLVLENDENFKLKDHFIGSLNVGTTKKRCSKCGETDSTDCPLRQCSQRGDTF